MISIAQAPYERVIRKFLPGTTDKVRNYLSNLKTDNPGVNKRTPLSDRVEREVVPLARKIIRTHTRDMHPELLALETKWMSRIDWPRSQYYYSKLLEKYKLFEAELWYPAWYYKSGSLPTLADLWDNLEGWDICIEQSDTYTFDRTGLDLSKGAGLPTMGPKEDALFGGQQYAESIKADPSKESWMILPGYRTDAAPLDEGKIRAIWGDPISEWYLEIEAFRSAINRTVEHAQSNAKRDLMLHYAAPEVIHDWIFRDLDWQTAVGWDMEAFDTRVTAHELAETLPWLAPGYDPEVMKHIVDHAIRAPVQLPDGQLLEREGGMGSGKIFTNLDDGLDNIWDFTNGLVLSNLRRWLKRFLVNGDDGVAFFDTAITQKNLEHIAKYTQRQLNVDKCFISASAVWTSKVLYTEQYFCKPIFLVLHRVIHREHAADPALGSKADVAVAVAQQLEWLAGHPLGEDIAKAVKRVDKYPINELPDEDVQQALNRWKADHPYVDQTGEVFNVDRLVEGFYASV